MQAEGAVPRYACPYCHQEGFTEDELVAHCPRYHGDENALMVCPICVAAGRPAVPVGIETWGYSVHLRHEHGTVPHPRIRPQTSTLFSLVVCRHPETGQFALVHECCKQGWYLPAGRVDAGETFEQAAVRETREEAGIEVHLDGMLRLLQNPRYGTMHAVFVARPCVPAQPLKSVPDYESLEARWFTLAEIQQLDRDGLIRGRSPDVLQFCSLVASGAPLAPLSMFQM